MLYSYIHTYTHVIHMHAHTAFPRIFMHTSMLKRYPGHIVLVFPRYHACVFLRVRKHAYMHTDSRTIPSEFAFTYSPSVKMTLDIFLCRRACMYIPSMALAEKKHTYFFSGWHSRLYNRLVHGSDDKNLALLWTGCAQIIPPFWRKELQSRPQVSNNKCTEVTRLRIGKYVTASLCACACACACACRDVYMYITYMHKSTCLCIMCVYVCVCVQCVCVLSLRSEPQTRTNCEISGVSFLKKCFFFVMKFLDLQTHVCLWLNFYVWVSTQSASLKWPMGEKPSLN